MVQLGIKTPYNLYIECNIYIIPKRRVGHRETTTMNSPQTICLCSAFLEYDRTI